MLDSLSSEAPASTIPDKQQVAFVFGIFASSCGTTATDEHDNVLKRRYGRRCAAFGRVAPSRPVRRNLLELTVDLPGPIPTIRPRTQWSSRLCPRGKEARMYQRRRRRLF